MDYAGVATFNGVPGILVGPLMDNASFTSVIGTVGDSLDMVISSWLLSAIVAPSIRVFWGPGGSRGGRQASVAETVPNRPIMVSLFGSASDPVSDFRLPEFPQGNAPESDVVAGRGVG